MQAVMGLVIIKHSVYGLLCIVIFVSLIYQDFVTLQYTMIINTQELKININDYQT